jgi:hypothetical protein
MEREMKMSKSSLISATYPAYRGNYTKGRSGRKVEAITIHHMAGKLTAEQCGRIFQTVGRNGSSHYGIGYNGEIANYVDEIDTAWTNSNWDSNCKSITIETSNDQTGGNWHVSDKSLNSLIKLVADIAKRNNLVPLVKGKNLTWHSMFANTACPGTYLMSKIDYIIAEANKINNTQVNVYYRVKTRENGWLDEVKNLNDYAGLGKNAIIGFMVKVDKGSIWYQAHVKGIGWLPRVTGYNKNDFNNGWAGDNRIIDCVRIYYNTPNNIRPFKKAKYRINNLPWQYDDEKGKGQDGYAGNMGQNAFKLEIVIE